MPTVEKILEEREKTHGKFCDHAYYTQSIKGVMRESVNWPDLSPSQAESLDMIAHKIGRILAGDPFVKDHWADIAGYAELVARELK